MNKKHIALLLSLVLTAGTISGCGQSTEGAEVSSASDTVSETSGDMAETEQKEETLSGKISVASNRTDLEERLSEYAQEFMDLHPGTTVEFETIKEYDDVIYKITGTTADGKSYESDKMPTEAGKYTLHAIVSDSSIFFKGETTVDFEITK